MEWLRRAVDEPAVESLSDEALLALCDATLSVIDQDALSNLLGGHREGSLSDEETARLDGLMASYRQGLVLKARALKEAVARGLRTSRTDNIAW